MWYKLLTRSAWTKKTENVSPTTRVHDTPPAGSRSPIRPPGLDAREAHTRRIGLGLSGRCGTFSEPAIRPPGLDAREAQTRLGCPRAGVGTFSQPAT
jgi:hypothetical protein